jgi:hypothetical protein
MPAISATSTPAKPTAPDCWSSGPTTASFSRSPRLKWGKIVSLHPYLDTQKCAAALSLLAGTGFAEAAAMPIED